MLQFQNLAIRRGPRELISGLDAQIGVGQKVGLTGANGSGKSSLFELLLGGLHADQGDFSYPDEWIVGHVAQETPSDDRPAIEFVLDGDTEWRVLGGQLTAAEAAHDGHAISELHERMRVIGGYQAPSRAAQLLYGLGFDAKGQKTPVNQFSGGWRMRLKLAQALMCRSDMLLLDEPTNHLDLDAVIWLEQWLCNYEGTLLLISHDREFLDSVVNNVLHIENGGAKLYRGNYSTFENTRAVQLAGQQALYKKQQRELAHIRTYVDRFRAKATKARQAQSRLKALERMKFIAPAHVDSPFEFSLFKPDRLPTPLLQLTKAEAGYGDVTVLQGLKMALRPGDRLGLLGANGAGKSTLIKLLAGVLQPLAGEREPAKETMIGYFAQHQLEQLNDVDSPLEQLQQLDPDAREQALRNYLGGYGFSKTQVESSVVNFSGGEKSRLVLAMLVYQKPNLLLLDEPTNHLDLEMRQALANAIQDFTGAIVLVSHDRHLLRVTCDQFLLVDSGAATEYSGDLEDYANWLKARAKLTANPDGKLKAKDEPKVASAPSGGESKQQRKKREARQRQKTKPLRNKIKNAEAELTRLRQSLIEFDQSLADNSLYTDERKEELTGLLKRKAIIQQNIDDAEWAWLAHSEELEQVMEQLLGQQKENAVS